MFRCLNIKKTMVDLLTISKVVSHLHTKYGDSIGTRSVTLSHTMVNYLLDSIEVVVLGVPEINQHFYSLSIFRWKKTRGISLKNISVLVLSYMSLFSFVCLFGLRLYVLVNNFSVMSGRSHRFLGITSIFWEVNVSCLRIQHSDQSEDRTPNLSLQSPTLYH